LAEPSGFILAATEQSLGADGAIGSFSSNFFPFSLNADRAPQLKASVLARIKLYGY